MLLKELWTGAPWGNYSLFSLINSNGIQVDISDLGASVINFLVSDQYNHRRNIVLGYDTPEQYLECSDFIGGVVGPWANRIRNGSFQIGQNDIQLEQNEGRSHLHGGSCALHRRRWKVELLAEQGITLSTKISKGEAGYPANIDIQVTYRLGDNNELSVSYYATVDEVTPLNLTQHMYINLNGGSGDIMNHRLAIDSDCFWSVDKESVPVSCESVEGTEMDFLVPKRIQNGFFKGGKYIMQTKGYDHCWCLNGRGFRPVSWIYENTTGIAVEVLTDQSGLQFYTGNHLTGKKGRDGRLLEKYSGLCLETQHYPDQVNMEAYKEDCLYTPDKPYVHKTVYQVIVQN